jgi:amidase
VDDELAFRPALELAELIRRREVSSEELVRLYRERIERLDPELNAYVTLADDEPAPREGHFAGVPISIKDLHETAGLRTTFSCRAFADHVPQFDAAAVRRLRDAGFVVLGKTNTPEFGTIGVTESELNGACRNPWNTSRTPGGSSGGAAAALAAGLCPAAHGSDGGGSIRNPSSCCGLVGLKPARGRVSPAPYGAGLLGLGTSGALTRTVRDAAALLDVLAGYESGDAWWPPPPPERPFADEPGTPPGRLRIAVTAEPPVDVPVDRACADAARGAGELLAELGHDVVERTPPWRSESLLRNFVTVWQAGVAVWRVDPELVEPLNRALMEDADATTSTDLAVAVIELQAHARGVVRFWEEVDVVVTPTLALPPVPVGWAAAESDPRAQFGRNIYFTPFTPLVNVTGQPAVSLPLSESEGLPIGVQLIGPPAGEALLLRLAAQLEEAQPWAERRPPCS